MFGVIIGIIIGVVIMVVIIKKGLSGIGNILGGAFDGIFGCLGNGIGCIATIVIIAILAIAIAMCS